MERGVGRGGERRGEGGERGESWEGEEMTSSDRMFLGKI